MRYASLLILIAFGLTGCESKAHKLAALQAQLSAANAAYRRDCPDTTDSGAARMLNGEKLTAAQMADLEQKRKAEELRCKPHADRLTDLQRQILAAQQ